MERSLLFSEIIALVEKCDFGGLKIKKQDITEKSDFIHHIGFDSLDKVELMMEVEHKYNIEISAEEENSICTIEDLIDLIIKKHQ